MIETIFTPQELGCDTPEEAEAVLDSMECVVSYVPGRTCGWVVTYDTDDQFIVERDWESAISRQAGA